MRMENHVARAAERSREVRSSTAALATMRRLERLLIQVEAFVVRRPYYGGLSINHPNPGDHFVHIIGADGARCDIRVLEDGSIQGTTPCH